MHLRIQKTDLLELIRKVIQKLETILRFIQDLMFTAKDLIGLYYRTTECLFLLVVFYLIMLLPASVLGSLLERRARFAGFGE